MTSLINSLAQHTPLESLLLLHALRSDGSTAIRFNQISEQLKSIPVIRNDPSFDSSRLEEDALKHLYLRLLKDEARDNLDQHQDRKRRQLSPSLPTVEEAAKHSHLIPRLVHRLYTRYREDVVAEIRNEEARYDSLTREIEEIENGQWDERLSKKQQPTPVVSAHPSPAATVQVQANGEGEGGNEVATTTAIDDQTQPQQSQEPTRLNRAKIDAVINHEPVAARPNLSPTPPLPSSSSQQQRPPSLQHRLSTTSLPPLSEMAPESPAMQPALPQHMQHVHVPPPQLPAPVQSAQGYRVSPVIQQNGFPPQFARSNSQQSPHHSPSPSSPRPVLPIPPGMNLPPPPHSPAMSNRGGPAQYPSPTQRMPPVPLQPATRAPSMHTPPTYHQPYQPYHPQPTYPSQQPPPQPYPSRPPHQGGYQLPPFQVSAQDPNRMHQHHLAQQAAQQHSRQPPTPARQPMSAPYSPHTPYAYPSAPHPRSESVNVIDVLSSLKKSSRPSTPRPTWKHFRPSYLSRPYMDEAVSPAVERLSPPSRAASPVASTNDAPVEQKTVEEPSSQLEPDETVVEPTPKPAKSTRRSTRRNRAASNASSAIASSTRARTRSHSVLSHAESHIATAEPSAALRVVKDEPMTPAELLQEEILQAETSDPPSQIRSARQRGRPTIGKRKRGRSPSVVASSEPPPSEEAEKGPAQEASLNNKVQAHRNFARISNVIINDITQHKHAGPFQKPVREKDAEGYSEIIKRPQDLKSIKAAITAGARAINAATSTTDSPFATPSGHTPSTSIILLDKTADLIPPRAIVNSSQLEKEVLRMFANAVMFNPGNEGIVQDAREMADDIEAKVRDWRQVEGAAASGRSGTADEDEETGTASKRRKV